ncbi:MAG: hypothetical protein M3Q69_17305 [Acidobacteriota bacterium]|nr:hypothetical protein [Acidobacteriota bacterium]
MRFRVIDFLSLEGVARATVVPQEGNMESKRYRAPRIQMKKAAFRPPFSALL